MVQRTEPTIRYVSVEGPVIRTAAGSSARSREMAARYSDDELRLIVDFYGRMEQVFREHLVRLRGGPEATEP